MKYQLKFIVNPVEIQYKFQLNTNEYSVEISMNYQWQFIGNPDEILMKYQLECQWNTNGNPIKFNENVNEIQLEISI